MAIRSGSSLRWIFPVALAVFLAVALTPISVPQERRRRRTHKLLAWTTPRWDRSVPWQELPTPLLKRRVCNRSHSGESPRTNLGQG